MHPILIKLGPVTLYSYGFMMAMGFLTCYYLLQREYRKRGENPDFASNTVFWAAISGIVGAKIFYIIENLSEFLIDPFGMIITGSGLVFHGGLIGGAIAVIVYLTRSKKSILVHGDNIIPTMFIGQAFGRIGCFLAGCCHGKACDLPWAITFPYASPPADFPVHPTQLYEAALNLILFFVLVKVIRPRTHKDGTTFGLYLILAGAERFFIEFLRVNPRYAFGLSSAQFTSIAIALAGVVLLVFFTKERKKK
ncbi:MAG: prolipoprotein diacylglyceryl transferase [Candidatus Neomarinimicrobiota bacterium]